MPVDRRGKLIPTQTVGGISYDQTDDFWSGDCRPPDAVARSVLRAIDRGTPVVYVPAIWRWVMLVIRWLPRAAMRRLGF